MQSRIFNIGDLKEEITTWNYPRYQINITPKDVSFFKAPLKEEFKIHLEFPQGKITDKYGNEYSDGFFSTNVVKDLANRFGKESVRAICAIWKNKKGEGILTGWFREYHLSPKDKVKIDLKDDGYYLESLQE
ncbi:MAG: hypothetical protein KAT83_01955 [Candidatus Aenigmarchaeota archaeon]|nr:hypothetical protein [Candidatus Aenigmarchaeota archaeon]